MVVESLVENVWISIALAVVSYILDHYLALYEIYLYQAGAMDYLVFKGRYEGAPNLTESDWRKWLLDISFLIRMLIISFGVYAGWIAFVKRLNRPEIFSFIMGGLILFRFAKSMTHFKNVSIFQSAQREGELEGKIEFSRRLSFTLLYLDMYSFTVLYLFLFILLGGWFLPGGILTCFIAARRHRDWVLIKT